MRQKRVKQYRKVMQLYQTTFGFREPYQLLVDSEFVKAFVDQKLDFEARVQDVLQGNVKPMITQCCIAALYELGPAGQPVVDLAKRFERRKCGHFKARPERECLTQMAARDNANRYVFATQDADLRTFLRTVPGTPIVYVSRSVVLLEAPSTATTRHRLKLEHSKLHASKEELAMLSGQPITVAAAAHDTAAADAGREVEEQEPTEEALLQKKKKKRKGPKGPNPLSVKKKKTTAKVAVSKAPQSMPRPTSSSSDSSKRKRKRKPTSTIAKLASADS